MSDQVAQLEMKASALSNSPPGKIILVDDEPELKNILVEALSAEGFDVAGFSSGHLALEELRRRDFDLLLTDLMMPEMDGIALLEAALQIDPQLIGIMMTGQGTIQTAVEAMKVGAFDYVLKPFQLQAVMPALTRAIVTRRLRMENLQLRETVGIFSLCQTIAFTLDPQTVISKLADAAWQQTDADEVSILLPTSDGSDELYVAAVRGQNRERLLGERVPLDESISGWVAREREPLMLEGEIDDERFRSLWPNPEIRSAIVIPMQVAGKLVGTININAVSRLRPFTPGQMKALTILAGTAAAALESASLYGQVRQAEENYRAIFENAVEGIFQSTPEGRFITANPAMARILGYASPEELIREVTDIASQVYVHHEDRTESARREQTNGVLQSFEFEAYRKNGEKIWLSLNRRSIRDENGAELYREGSVEDITERKRTETEKAALTAEIETQNQRLDNMIASVPGVVWEAWGQPDANTQRIDFVSDYVEAMLGYSVDEWLSTPNFWLTIVHPDDRDYAAREAAQSFATGKNSTVEFRWMAKDGRAVWVESNYVVIKDDDGRPVGLRGVTTDIGERKRVDEIQARRAAHALFRADVSAALAASRAPLRGTLQSCAEAMVQHLGAAFARVWTLNREENVLELQASAGMYTHIDGDHGRVPVGKFKIGKIAEERAAHITNDVQNDPRVGDKEWAKREGMIAFAGHPLQVEDRVIGVVAMFSRQELPEDTLDALASVADVISQSIDRKRAEHELKESEERYRDLVENAHDIIFSHDLDGKYTSVNRAGEQITGYTHEECLSLNIADTIAPEHAHTAREMLAKKLAGEKVTAYEVELLAKDGKRIAVEVNTKLILQDGVPVGVQGIARDVTERKLLEDQLRQSQKMEAIGQLAGGVAHDFNNLLTAINGYSSLALQRIEDNPTVKSYLEEIKKAGDRAANLTRQLLAFGRKQILQPLPLNLNDTVTDMNKMLRRLIGEDIQLSAKLTPDLKRVKADPGQIEQVLVNLVVNARDAMPEGGRLTIETANAELGLEYASTHVGVNAGDHVVLAVSDTGTGMSDEVKRHIFEPFFTTKEKGKGTGLGLSTVYGIVKQSGGNISAYSEPNHGTTFKVYLPALDAVAKSPAASAAEGAIPKGSETVLLVEDEEVVRGLACQILEEAGYQVLVAQRGEEAIRLGSEHAKEIQLLLTDVVMPGAGGKEVADRLSSMCPGIKVLFMSGYTDEAIVHHGVLDSNVKFIQKPFSPAALAKKVREVLDSNGKGPTE